MALQTIHVGSGKITATAPNTAEMGQWGMNEREGKKECVCVCVKGITFTEIIIILYCTKAILSVQIKDHSDNPGTFMPVKE